MMDNNRKFLRCKICGNVVGMIESHGHALSCCGQEMVEIVPNKSEGAQEKHLPVATREDKHLFVQIGALPHPMTDEHHIAWVAVAQGADTQRHEFGHTDAPKAKFHVAEGPVTVYAYCNLHGLWATEM